MAAAELAMVLGVIITLLMGMFDLGLWVWQGMALESALFAGVHYAQEFPTDSQNNTGGTASAVIAALPSGMVAGTTYASSIAYECASAAGAATTAAGPGECAEGQTQRVFVTLTLTHPFSPLYLNVLNNLITISAQNVIRIQ